MAAEIDLNRELTPEEEAVMAFVRSCMELSDQMYERIGQLESSLPLEQINQLQALQSSITAVAFAQVLRVFPTGIDWAAVDAAFGDDEEEVD
jgi:hypothetical protein